MQEIYFENYGCVANQNSTEIMKGLVKQSGLNITENSDYADLIIINSCVVKESTISKIRRRIQELLKKNKKNFQNKNSLGFSTSSRKNCRLKSVENKKIILAGCMPRIFQKYFKDKKIYLLDTSHIKDLLNLIKDIENNNYDEKKYLSLRNEVKLNLPKISESKIIRITQISEGCLGECSYCLTRFAKGKLFSYPEKEIIESIKKDLSSGAKEIWITSQDNASYGNETGNYFLPELLKKILELKGNFKVRLGMMNPNNVLKILDDIIEIYQNPKMFKFIHIPVQTGSDKILKLMNRMYNAKDFLKIVKKFREKIPEITISTDIISGFPEETEKDFQETIGLIQKIKPEILNRSNFSSHKQTSASKLKNKIPEKIITQRATELMKIHLEICDEIQKNYLGKELKVFVDERGFGNTFLARTENYKLVAVQSSENILGKFVKVKIKKLFPHYLIGEIVKNEI